MPGLDDLWPPNLVTKLAQEMAKGGAAGEAARKLAQQAIEKEVNRRVAARCAAMKHGSAATLPGWVVALGLALLLD